MVGLRIGAGAWKVGTVPERAIAWPLGTAVYWNWSEGEESRSPMCSFGPEQARAGVAPHLSLSQPTQPSSAASWHRREVLSPSPSRVHSTYLSRITRDPSTWCATPGATRNTSSQAVKIGSCAFGTPTWAQRSRPIQPTATRSSRSQCKSKSL